MNEKNIRVKLEKYNFIGKYFVTFVCFVALYPTEITIFLNSSKWPTACKLSEVLWHTSSNTKVPSKLSVRCDQVAAASSRATLY